MNKKLRAMVVAGALAAMTMLPAAPAGATHACSIDDESGTVGRICESHPEYELLNFIYCLFSKYC
ncbi:MAG TPA: hypothetical protein VG318_18545 [Actinomycetota bacterium]|nr:hypothetical protein [Actinomycetota bacterium]